MMTAREHDDRKGHHYYTRLRTPCLRGLGSGGAGPQYISQKTFCESNEAASGSKALQECHPERSEGSHAGYRSFAALRMTQRDGLVFEMFCPLRVPSSPFLPPAITFDCQISSGTISLPELVSWVCAGKHDWGDSVATTRANITLSRHQEPEEHGDTRRRVLHPADHKHSSTS